MLTLHFCTGIDPDLLEDAVARSLAESRTVVLTYAELPGQRVVRTAGALLDRSPIRYDGHCLDCSLVAEIRSAIELLADLGRWQHLVVVLRAGMSAAAAVSELAAEYLVSEVVAVVDAATLLADLSGDELLDDRGLAAGRTDRRSIAEVVAGQVEFADTVCRTPSAGAGRTDVVELLNPDAASVGPAGLRITRDLPDRATFDLPAALDRIRPGLISAPLGPPAADRQLLWRSNRPMHPVRLRERLAELVDGTVLRSRGRLWLANRSSQMLAWDSAGRSASIGGLGTWLADLPEAEWSAAPDRWRASAALDWDPEVGDRCCELQILGVRLDPERLTRLLSECVLSEAEFAAGPAAWARLPDPFAAALGVRSDQVPTGFQRNR